MDILDQIKTPQGRLPVRNVALVPNSEGREGKGGSPGEGGLPVLEFSFANPQDIAGNPILARMRAVLEDVAFVGRDTLLSVAKTTGPLFGASARESVLDWQSAANIARAAIMMQEVANGSKPPLVLKSGIGPDESGACLVGKTSVQSALTGEKFLMYAVSFAVDAERAGGYVAMLPRLPWFKKFSGSGCFDYLFVNIDHEGGRAFLSVVLLSFTREIAPEDFAAMLLCYCDGEEAARSVLGSLRDGNALSGAFLDAGDVLGLLAIGGELFVREEEIDEGDRPKLARLVQGIVSLHVQGATVDLFRSDETTGFLAFNSALAFLWYDFARKLGQVRVGYCQQCGRPFPLSGHRGIPKRFCSEACKTKAKNERQRSANERLRRRFLEGESVEDVARVCYPKDAGGVAREKVLRSLRQWVELRHKVEDELAHDGSLLVQRCIDEGVYTAEEVESRRKVVARKQRKRRT